MSDAVHMPDESIRTFLGLRLVATLGTVNDDGSMLLTPIWYVYEDGRLYLPTGSRTRKAQNIRARPGVTVIVDQRGGERPRWASAVGTAELLSGADARAINQRVRARYLTTDGEATYGRLIDASDDVTIAVTPQRWQSWSPGVLAQVAEEHGLSTTDVAGWFQPLD